MCLLLTQNLASDKTLTKTMFLQIWTENPHGAGVGYFIGHNPIILNAMTYNTAWNNYKRAALEVMNNPFKEQHKMLIVHFRIKTHGSENLNNCHPFYIEQEGTPGAILGHNGVTNTFGVAHPPDWSDTRTLACMIPKKAPFWQFDNKDYELIKKELGASRCAIITPTGYKEWNFPSHQEFDVKDYGRFSNFFWNRTTWKGGNGFTFMSDPTVDRVLAYCIANQITVAQFILMMAEIKEAPTQSDWERYIKKNKLSVQTACNYHETNKTFTKSQIDTFPRPLTSDDLAEHWLKTQGLVWRKQKEETPTKEDLPIIDADFPRNDRKRGSGRHHADGVISYGPNGVLIDANDWRDWIG